jgi:hypothetical protein
MIPRYSKTFNLDTSYLRKSIGFKHGLMLLYQFIHFINEINEKGYHFGFLNFSSLYFLKNEGKKTTAKKSKSKSRRNSARSVKSNNSSGESCQSSRTFRDA